MAAPIVWSAVAFSVLQQSTAWRYPTPHLAFHLAQHRLDKPTPVADHRQFMPFAINYTRAERRMRAIGHRQDH